MLFAVVGAFMGALAIGVAIALVDLLTKRTERDQFAHEWHVHPIGTILDVLLMLCVLPFFVALVLRIVGVLAVAPILEFLGPPTWVALLIAKFIASRWTRV